ncbi:MAG: glycine betaine ABC transporter substrate-binding protein [Bryobacteraceae bacterium]|nr:glycine betaine ABC transporter substrate-binding protein [Bryobacteraceae bacterium]
MGRATLLLVILCAAWGCGTKPRLVVGSKNFTEQVILGEILAQQIERRLGVEVDRRLNLGGTLLAHEALKSGGIDLYPEYTGTGLTAILKAPPTKDRRTALERVRQGYAPLGLRWLDPLGFDNTFAMVVTAANPERTLSEAARRPAPWRLGVGYEFVERPDGLRGLVETYGLRLQGDPVTMDLGLLYPALGSGKIEMGAASATDGLLANPSVKMLEDDQHYFPPYECAVVVREDALQRFPGLLEALTQLSGRIAPETMRKLNRAADIDRRPVPEVAREFLSARTGRE